MKNAGRFSLAALLVVVTAVAVAIAGWSKSFRLERERDVLASLLGGRQTLPNDSYLRHMPLSVAMSDQNGMRIEGNWFASTNAAGAGVLEIRGISPTTNAEFKATPQLLDALRDAVIKEHFFELPSVVGELVPDGSTQSITIVVGEYSKTVQIEYLGNIAARAATFSTHVPEESASALRVWLQARDFFSHPQAFDSRQYDQAMLLKLDRGMTFFAPTPAPTATQTTPAPGGSTAS